MELETRLQSKSEEMRKPLVSVVMPVRNAEKYLDSAVVSVLEQGLADFEFIIIDDASSDGSTAIIVTWAERDKRIKLRINPEQMGVTKCLNIGLGLAQGKYIARMDGDDLSLPGRFQTQVDFLEAHKDVYIVGSYATEIDEQGNESGEIRKLCDSQIIKEKIFYYSPCVHPSIMFRRELIEEIGKYDETYRFCQDQDLYLRTIFSGYKIANLPLFLLQYRRHPGSVDRNRLMRAGISLKIKKAIIKKFKLQVSIGQYLFFYVYYIIEGWLPLKLRYSLEAVGRKILLRAKL